jgi:hypothetical protein
MNQRYGRWQPFASRPPGQASNLISQAWTVYVILSKTIVA